MGKKEDTSYLTCTGPQICEHGLFITRHQKSRGYTTVNESFPPRLEGKWNIIRSFYNKESSKREKRRHLYLTLYSDHRYVSMGCLLHDIKKVVDIRRVNGFRRDWKENGT
ncbi:hypothetical protein CEXT_694481 [Caerostris extrusa]|uniref:LAGLIDADG homing endonuclease n=1 Tax=Caerostris extrusa TaxID=172846 RepID=A0AAV4T2S5_CAEEX|nr:hypothetical protein CEXT_694481 [Caerostris extrusa]